MPFVAGGAAANPPRRTFPNPRAPLPPSKKQSEKLCSLKAFFSGPRLALFMAFFRVIYGSLLQNHYFPSLRASWCRF